MKKNKTSLLVIMIIITMVALIVLSGTYAKYTAEVGATGMVSVATWDVTFKDGENDFDGDFVFMDGTKEFIQPGTTASKEVKITNNSDVTAKIEAEVDTSAVATDLGITENQLKVTVSKDGVELGENNKIFNLAKDESATVVVTVAWEYDSDENVGAHDENDTAVGAQSYTNLQAGERTFANIGFTLNAVQLNPNDVII